MLLADGRIGCVFSEASAEAEKILSQEIYQTCATEVLRSPNNSWWLDLVPVEGPCLPGPAVALASRERLRAGRG